VSEKCLKIPKKQSEAVHQIRKDNKIAKRKGTKGQAINYKTIHRKRKIEQHMNIRGVNSGAPTGE